MSFPWEDFGGIEVQEETPPWEDFPAVEEKPVVRDTRPFTVAPGMMFPAVRLIGGEVATGKQGDTHPDIIRREEIPATDIDQRGFTGPDGQFYDREAAATATGIPTEFEPGRLHSTDLAKAQEATARIKSPDEVGRVLLPATGERSTTYGGPPKTLADYAETMGSVQVDVSDLPVSRIIAPRVSPTEPRVELPTIIPPEDASFIEGAASEVVNSLSSVPQFFTSDVGIASLMAAKLAPRLVSAGFSADLTYSAFIQAKEAYENWDAMTPAQKGKAAAGVLMSLVFGGLTGAHAAGVKLPKPTPEWQGPVSTGAVLERPKGAVPSERAQALAAVREQTPEVVGEPITGEISPAAEQALRDAGIVPGAPPPEATPPAPTGPPKPTPPTKPTPPEAEDSPQVVAKKKEIAVKRRVEEGIPDENVNITIIRDESLPEPLRTKTSVVQVDEFHPTKGNLFLTTPEKLREFGMDIPDSATLLRLPAGQYKLKEVRERLAKPPDKAPETQAIPIIQSPSGKIYTGTSHADAFLKAIDAGEHLEPSPDVMAQKEALGLPIPKPNYSSGWKVGDEIQLDVGQPIPPKPPATKAPEPTPTVPVPPTPAKPAGAKTDEPPKTTTSIDPRHVETQEVPVSEISLSSDVPNFKGEADPETGIIPKEQLSGEYERRGTAPIVLWRRLNGALEVITGRHRLDLAKRTGEKTIPAQIVEESKGFTKDMAMAFDAEANIRDGQGSVEDYAHYFKLKPDLNEQEAQSRGLLSRSKGRSGWDLAKAASNDLYAAWRGGKVTEAQALAIARSAPSNPQAQQIGIKFAVDGKPPEFLSNVIKSALAESKGQAETLDLFGSDDAAMQTMAEQAERASLEQKSIRDQIQAASGAAKRPEIAKKLGIDVNDPDAVRNKLTELRAELVRWENWPLHPDLVERVRGKKVVQVETKPTAVKPTTVEPPTVTQRPLTKAEQNEFEKLTLIDRAARESGGDPLTTEQTKRYQYLTALAGQKELLAESPTAGIQGQISQLQAKLTELDRLRVSTQNRAWESKHRRSELIDEARAYEAEASKVRNQIRELEKRLGMGPGTPSAGPGEIIGFGGAIPSEFKPTGATATSIKNAVVDAERAQRGEPPMMDVIRRGREEVWQKAMAILDRDPMAREKLVAELIRSPRAINDFEVALLDHYRVDLKNEYAKATREAARAADDGRLHDLDRLNDITNMWSDKLLELEQAAGKGGAGTETARGLAYRRHMVNDDFTLAALEMEKRKANGYRKLTPDERAELQAQADAHKAKADELESRLAKAEAELDAKEIEFALKKEKLESKHPPIVIQMAEQIVASWDRRADAARARLKERMSRMGSGPDPTVILDLAEVGLSHVGHMALDAAKFTDRIVTEFGDWVKPHAQAAWDKLQELIEAEKSKTKPGTARATAVQTVVSDKQKNSVTDLQSRIQKRLKKDGQGDISYQVRKLCRTLIEQEGITDLNTLVDRVHEVLTTVIPDITRREAMDAISGYGKFKPLPKDAVSVILRDLVGQAQQIAKLEDMAAGKAPQKTGWERRTPSDIEREKIKLVEEAKRRGGYTITDPETQLRSAMQAVHTRLTNQIKDLESQIASREKIIKNPTKLVYDEKANQLVARRDELMDQFNALFPKEPITEAQRLANWKTRTIERMNELKARLAAGDFSKRTSRQPVQLDSEAMRIRFDLHTIERQILEGRAAEQRRMESAARKGLRYSGEIINTFRALKTSYDLSAVLRQGAFIGFGHPIRALKSFPAMFKAMASERGQFAVAEEIRNRPNAPMYDQAKLYLAEHGGRLSKMEEVYMSRWAEKIPGVRASERAYVMFLNKLRADSFDAMASTLSKNGTLTLPQAKIVANYINVATGRGSVALDQAAVALNTAFFAPRYVASRFQLLSGQPLWGGGAIKGQARVRALIAAEYARFLAGAAVVYTLGMAAGANVETDPRSADFGKLRFDNTRLDPMAGLIQATVVTSRLTSGKTKTAKGEVIPIRGKVPYGHGDASDVTWRFIRSKLSPAVGETINVASGKDIVGNPVTAQSIPSRLLAPIGVMDIYQTMQKDNVPADVAFATLSIFGMGLQTYQSQDGGRAIYNKYRNMLKTK